VLNIFQRAEDGCEPRTANEVADELGCARQTAYRKLEELAEQEKLKTKKSAPKVGYGGFQKIKKSFHIQFIIHLCTLESEKSVIGIIRPCYPLRTLLLQRAKLSY
jgi:hypothetical protein